MIDVPNEIVTQKIADTLDTFLPHGAGPMNALRLHIALSAVAHVAYREGKHDALMGLHTAEQLAEEFGGLPQQRSLMKRCVVCGRETYHKFEEYTVCAACDVDGSFDYYLKQSIAAQQKHAPDVVDSAASVSIFPALEVSASEAKSAPATTQVM